MSGILRWLKLEWWMAAGRVDYKRDRYQAALHCFQQVVALYPKHLLALSYVGACYMALQQYDNAVLAFERGLQIKSDSAYCHAEIGCTNVYLSKGREAVESLKRAFRINPKYEQNGTYVLALADTYALAPDYEASAKFYAAAIRLLPGNEHAHHGLGWALRSSGKSHEAESPLRNAIALEPNEATSHNELARTLFDMDRWAEAEQEFRRAIQLDPDNPDHHDWLGTTLGRQERFSEEVPACLEAIRLNPEHEDAYFNLGIAYTMVEDYEAAIKAYESALRLSPDPSSSLLACLAADYLHCKLWDELLRTSEQFVKRYPEEFDAHFYQAYAYTELDRDREAIKSYDEALRLQPDSFHAVANLALNYLKLEKLLEAVDAFMRAIDLMPGDAEVHLKLGETYVKLGDMTQAHEQLRILEDARSDSAKELSGIITAASLDEPLTPELSH